MRIIVRLQGDYTDQLWQYAYALYLQQSTSAELWLDTSLLTEASAVGYALGAYHLSLAVAPSWAADEVLRGDSPFARLKAWVGYAGALRVEGRDDVSPEGLMAAQGDVVLRGRFRYAGLLSQVAETLRKDTDLNETALDAYHRRLLHLIRERQAVGIALGPSQRDRLRARGAEAYVRALESAPADCLPDDAPRLIFTDDVGWARQHLQFRNAVQYVPLPQQRNMCYEVHLMRCCRFFVTDGSPLSAWVSFLAEPGRQVTITPDFGGAKQNKHVPERNLV